MPFKRDIFLVVFALVALMFSGTLSEMKEGGNNVLVKTSIKMTFDDNDGRTKVTSGPVYFKNDGVKLESEGLVKEFLRSKKFSYGLDESLEDIRITRVLDIPGGTAVHFIQVIDNIPVYMSNSSVSINDSGIITWANIFYRPSAKLKKNGFKTLQPRLVSAETAVKTAYNYLDIKGRILKENKPSLKWYETADRGIVLAWELGIRTDDPDGSWQLFVDAENGTVLQAIDCRIYASGSGMVFNPNPLTTAHVPYGTPYVDSNDFDIPELNAERQTVVLKDITFDGTHYKLDGPYCVMRELGGITDTFPERSDGVFNYTRAQDEFEAVMCYYHIDSSARYINTLGFYNSLFDTLNVDPHGLLDAHNAYFNYYPDTFIVFGDKEIDAAEDASVIIHEYGHAVECFLAPGFGPAPDSLVVYGNEYQAVWEGMADYWSGSYRIPIDTFAWQHVAYWWWFGSTNMNSRFLNRDWKYPEVKYGYDGAQILSSALMKIWWAVGKETADSLVLRSLTTLSVLPVMTTTAMALINADYDLYGGLHRKPILEAFDEHRIIRYIDSIPKTIFDSTYFLVNPTPSGLQLRTDEFEISGNTCIDAEHFLHLNHRASLNISTCNIITNFNTVIGIFSRTNSDSVLYSNNDAGCTNATASALYDVNLDTGEYYIVVEGNSGDKGAYRLDVGYSRSLELYTADQQYSSGNLVNPIFYIKNIGSQSVSNFSVGYYFTADDGKTPIVEDYYTPDCTPYLQNLGNGYYRVLFVFSGFTLLPGERFPSGGTIQAGFHYTDWSPWNKRNDFSQPKSATLFKSSRFPVFNSSGYLIYGRVPDLVVPLLPKQDLKVYMKDETFAGTQQSQPRFYINNAGSTELSDFTMKYYFTVENKKTPEAGDYWTPNCNVTLQHIGEAEWCVALDFNGYTLQPGGRVPANDGQVFGLHYTDWSTWNKSNDYSQPTSADYTLTDKVAVFNSSNELVYGTTP